MADSTLTATATTTGPFRDYDAARDVTAVRRIWTEVGWIEGDKFEPMDLAIQAGRAMVADIDGEPECLVLTCPGVFGHQRESLPFSCVTGVTTSRIARKQGFAARLTSRCLALDVAEGAIVAGLGMFEQGYYDRLGFGSGAYEMWMMVDPATLKVPPAQRVPKRLGKDDWQIVHECRLRRRLPHGSASLLPAEVTRAEMAWARNGFGLGYCDGPDGELTHHVWMAVREDVEHGPYSVWWMAYETADQLVELLGLLRNLGDQVHAVRMREPTDIQLQDLMTRPFERLNVTKGSDFDSRSQARAVFQYRICDVPACLDATRLPGADMRFNLRLSDPIERHLPEDEPWRGVAGDYVVSLGPLCGAEQGHADGLPVLDASVGAFTRLWLGVRPASGLAVTDEIAGPPDLLEALDDAVRLPDPRNDWDF